MIFLSAAAPRWAVAGVWVVRADFVIMYPVNRATPDLVYTRSVGGGVNTPLKEGEGISTSTMKNQ